MQCQCIRISAADLDEVQSVRRCRRMNDSFGDAPEDSSLFIRKEGKPHSTVVIGEAR